MRTKIKYYGDEVTDFYDKEIPKVDSNRTRLAVISLHSPLNKDYPQVFLKECKYIEKKVIRDICMILMILMKNRCFSLFINNR